VKNYSEGPPFLNNQTQSNPFQTLINLSFIAFLPFSTFSRDIQTEQQNTPSLALGTTLENQFDHQQEQLLLLTI
jgi:hypothetical protein